MKKLISLIMLTFLLAINSYAEDLSDLISPETFIIDYGDLYTEQINASMPVSYTHLTLPTSDLV